MSKLKENIELRQTSESTFRLLHPMKLVVTRLVNNENASQSSRINPETTDSKYSIARE